METLRAEAVNKIRKVFQRKEGRSGGRDSERKENFGLNSGGVKV